MLKHLLFSSALLSVGFALSLPATAQSTERTVQTDQSEEDWRRSQRKADGEDREDIFDPSQTTGAGGVLPPLRPIDSLPTESRRHLSKQRAIAIAGMGSDGQVQNTSYEPSDAAKSDPNLAAEEEAVWKEMMEDLQGSGGNSNDGTRESDQAADQTGAMNGSQTNRQSASNGQPDGQGGQSEQNGQTGRSQSGQSSSSGGGGSSSGESVMRGGSAASASDILKQMRGLSSGSDQPGGENPSQSPSQQSGQAGGSRSGQQGGAGESGQAGQPGSSGAGQSSSEDGSSASGANGDNSSGSGDASEGGASAGAGGAQGSGGADQPGDRGLRAPVAAPIGGGAQVGASGSTSSASDFLKKQTGGEASDNSGN